MYTKSKNIYIGSSNHIDRRWKRHVLELNTQQHINTHLQRAWDKYTSSAFVFELIEECSIDDLLAKEQHYLDQVFETGNVFNLSPTANTQRGFKHSEESKRKMSLTAKGRIFSDEHRRKLSEGQKRRNPPSEETRLKLSLGSKSKGRKLTDEHKNKISKGLLRRKDESRSI